MNFFRSVLFHMKTGGYRKYFVRGCRIPDNLFLVHMIRKVPHWITSQLQRFLDLRMLSKPRYKWWYLVFWRQRGEIPPLPASHRALDSLLCTCNKQKQKTHSSKVASIDYKSRNRSKFLVGIIDNIQIGSGDEINCSIEEK